MLVKQNQQQSIEGYETIYLFWPRNQPFHISHINPSRQDIHVMDSYHSIDLLMLFPYILTSFEKY